MNNEEQSALSDLTASILNTFERTSLSFREIILDEYIKLNKKQTPNDQDGMDNQMGGLLVSVLVTFVCEELKNFSLKTQIKFTKIVNTFMDGITQTISANIHLLNECENCKETKFH